MPVSFPIPVARPLLPRADRILPYLREMDGTRIYANFGPLTGRFEARLAERFAAAAVTTANCTLGLTAVLMVQGAAPGGRCFMPSWTFCATAQAARMAGLQPYFLDVDVDTWQLAPERVERSAPDLRKGDAVIAVAPFGSPVEVRAWDDFTARTGVPVVIDAASAFASQTSGATPVVVSLHATKVLGVGEGGFVFSSDAGLIRAVRRAVNFGFTPSRQVTSPGMNAKMAEATAAVGLAALDEWDETLARWSRVRDLYRQGFAGLGAGVVLHRCGVTSTLLVRLPVDAAKASVDLDRLGVGNRRWWGDGCHLSPAFAGAHHEPLPVTEQLARSCLGLPIYQDMTEEEIAAVLAAVGEVVRALPRTASSPASAG